MEIQYLRRERAFYRYYSTILHTINGRLKNENDCKKCYPEESCTSCLRIFKLDCFIKEKMLRKQLILTNKLNEKKFKINLLIKVIRVMAR